MDAARLYAERILDMRRLDPNAKQDYTLMSLLDGQTTIHMAKDVTIEPQLVRPVAGGHTALSSQLDAVALSGVPFLLT